MVKIKTINKKSLIGKTLALTSLVALTLLVSPIKAHAWGVLGDPSTSKLTSVAETPTGLSSKMSFNDYGENQKNWYEGSGKTSNIVFLQGYKGVTWYSPIPLPDNSPETETRAYDDFYENIWNGSGGTSFKDYSKSRVNYLNSDNIEYGDGYDNMFGRYKGQNGEWRFMGYSSCGTDISNPYFPPDGYSDATPGNYGYDITPWIYYNGCNSTASIWDNADDSRNYPMKLDALRKLIQQEDTMKPWSAESWAPYLSLRSDPFATSAVFVGTRDNGAWYRDLVVKGPVKNLRVVSETVADKNTGTIVGTFTRNDNDPDTYTPTIMDGTLDIGGEYTVTVKVKNMSDTASVTNPSKLDVGYGTGSVADSNNPNFSDNQYDETLTNDIYAPQETKEYTWNFTVDEQFKKKARVTAVIDAEHQLNGDNLDGNDDTAWIKFKIAGLVGSFGTDYIKLVDKNGVEHDKAQPGQQYKIRYYIHYTGADIKYAVYRTCSHKTYSHQVFDHWVWPYVDIPLKAEIDRNIPPVYQFAEVYKEDIPKRSQVHNGDTFVYTTKEYRMYEVPVFRTKAIVDPKIDEFDKSQDTGDTLPDIDTSDNTLSAEWHEFYDLIVSNVRVKPITETPYVPGYQTFAVQYDIESKAPTWFGTYEVDTNTMVVIKGQQFPMKVHVQRGLNTNITE